MNELAKELRTRTGLSLYLCREATEKFGNFEEAYDYLKAKWSGVWSINPIYFEHNIK